MAITLNGDGTVTGLTAIPDGIVTNDDLAGSIAVSKLATTGSASSSTFLDGSGAWASAGGGKVLKIIQTPFTSTGSAALTYPTWSSDIFTGSITPSATSSKVWVMVSTNLGVSTGTHNVGCRLLRGTTVIGSTPDTPGTRLQCFGGGRGDSNASMQHYTINYLDTPSSTSAVTYAVQITIQSGTVYVNRSGDDGADVDRGRAVSHITLMEIGA